MCYVEAAKRVLFYRVLQDSGSISKSVAKALDSATGDVVGKVTVGYQSWFSAAGDGSPSNSWNHDNLEMWPDQREYTTLYSGTPFGQSGVAKPGFTGNLGNGQPAKMFSAYDQSTVNLHFSWMQQYGIDCAALQRFANEITPGSTIKAQRDGMGQKVMSAAQNTGVKFYIMYDVSGWGNLAAIESDWTNTIVNTLHLTSSSAYAKQNGMPVICIYGLGYANHPSSPSDALSCINWFKSQGLYVIGSVPGQWRTGTGDARSDFGGVWPAFNMISAWAVGRAVDASYQPWVTGDLAYCNANGMDYQPCAYPGTAFYNTNGPPSQKNGFPRNHGDFMWSQFAVMKNAGVKSMYIAMFDEMNEATSIFKCAEDSTKIPAGQYFLTLDADGTHVSSDFYLRLVQDGGKMIKGQIPYTTTEPTPFIVSPPIANGTYKIVSRNSGYVLDAQGAATVNGTPIQQYGYNVEQTSNGLLPVWGTVSIKLSVYKAGAQLMLPVSPRPRVPELNYGITMQEQTNHGL